MAEDSSKPKSPYEELSDAERDELDILVAGYETRGVPRSLWFGGLSVSVWADQSKLDRFARAWAWLEQQARQASAPPAQREPLAPPAPEAMPALAPEPAPTLQPSAPAAEQTPPASAPAQPSTPAPLAPKEWYTKQFVDNPKPEAMTPAAYGRQLATVMKRAAEAGEVRETLGAKTLTNRYAEWLTQPK
jgi:hypothetical protein